VGAAGKLQGAIGIQESRKNNARIRVLIQMLLKYGNGAILDDYIRVQVQDIPSGSLLYRQVGGARQSQIDRTRDQFRV
jgi:hypothetical protein